MSEQEYHPADAHFNPAHPDHKGWRGPKPPDMPAEAGIVEMFTNPNGPIQESDVDLSEQPKCLGCDDPDCTRDHREENAVDNAETPSPPARSTKKN